MNIFIRILLGTGLWLLSWFIAPVCRLLQIGERKKCPPVQNPLLMHSAKTLAYLIRTRQVKCEEVVRALTTRAYEVNKILNAIVEPRYVEALQEAQAVDKMLAMEEKSEEQIANETPLLGVPITVKESIAVEGMSNDAGRVFLEKQVPASDDAEVIRSLKAAGAIPILVSNTPDQCMFWETYNKVTGLTRNPFDTRRTVGGSSGGEAALLGSGASLIGIGSDVAGSLRLPAMYVGVFGHKPSPRTISIEGHIPACKDKKFLDHFILGPMVRYMEDLPMVLNIMVKDEYRSLLKLNEEVPITEIKFYYMEHDSNSHLSNRVDRDTISQMRKFIIHLQNEYGIKAQKVDIELMKNAYEMAILVLLQIDELECPFYDEVTPKQLQGVWKELFKWLTCRSRTIFPVIFYGLLKIMSQKLKGRCQKANEYIAKMKKEFKDLLGNDGVFLFPTFTTPAGFHYETYYKMFDLTYLIIFNALGLPVTNCPIGFNSGGLPLGMQVAANPNNDRLTIAVGKEIERVFGGWRPPPSTNEEGADALAFVKT